MASFQPCADRFPVYPAGPDGRLVPLAFQSFPLCSMRQLRVLLLDLNNEHLPPPGYVTGVGR